MPGDNECGVGDQGVHAAQLPDVRAPIKREWYCEKMLKIVVEPVIIRRQKHLLRTRIHQRSRPETAAQRALHLQPEWDQGKYTKGQGNCPTFRKT